MNGDELTPEQAANIQDFHRYLVADLERKITFIGGELSEVEADINNAYEAENAEELLRDSRLVYAAMVQASVSVSKLLREITQATDNTRPLNGLIKA